MNKKDENKFNFVSMDDLENVVNDFNESQNIELVDNPKKANVLKFKYEEENIDDVVENINKNTNSSSNIPDHEIKGKVHFSFGARVFMMLSLTILLFCFSCVMILKTINYGKYRVVSYTEDSSVDYTICLNPRTANDSSVCYSNSPEYDGTLIDSVKVDFKYSADLSEAIKYDMKYRIAIRTMTYDANDSSKIIYDSTEDLTDKKSISDISSRMSITASAKFDYQKYNQIIINHKNDISKDVKGDIIVTLYLDNDGKSKELASVKMPLDVENLRVNKTSFGGRSAKKLKIKDNTWNSKNTIYAVISGVLVIITLIILYNTLVLVLKGAINRNKYQKRLSQILRDYDRIIVVARDGYVSNVNREVVKMKTFDELLGIKENLSKPIIYSRINDVKSEFIVEDDNKLYKFVLKDTDL